MSNASSALNDQNLLQSGKRLTEQEKARFADKQTLREIDAQSKNNKFRGNDPSYVHDRLNEEWSIYFDFEDFKKFK